MGDQIFEIIFKEIPLIFLCSLIFFQTEEESESDNEENVDDPEPAKYAAAGEDTEQPGPSGLGKGGTDAP